MRVKMKTAIAGSAGVFEAGMIADLPEAMALALVAEGCAVLMVTRPAAVVETAAVAASETAKIPYSSPRRGRK